MPDILPGVTLLVGSGQWDARPGPQVVDTAVPFVMWTLPAGYRQKRFSLRVENAEPDGFAFITSGPRFTGEHFCQFSDALQLNTNFNGLCRVSVMFSQQDSGAFEHVSDWHYFVYDTGLERVTRANQIRISFQGATDPDGLPSIPETRFHLQISEDPQFETIAFEDDQIFPSSGSLVNYDIPTTFNPTEDKPYFYRVRQFDGMDYSDWSLTHGFKSYQDRGPSITIDSVEPTGNDSGDTLIHFTVSDEDNDFCSVELSFLGGNAAGIKQPLTLLGPTIRLSTGPHTATWRTLPQFGYEKTYSNIVIYARAHDGQRISDEVFYGPITIDTSYIEKPPGGVGSTEIRYPVTAGHLAKIIRTENEVEKPFPAQGAIVTSKLDLSRLNLPVQMGPYAFHNMFSLGPIEPYFTALNYHMGFGHTNYDPGRSVFPVNRQVVIAQDGYDAGKAWSNTDYEIDLNYRTYIDTDRDSYLFSTPYDTRNPDTLPKRFNSRSMDLNPFLSGYLDLDGNPQEYPDNYDWNNRPLWHIGREIWSNNDAWIQVAWWEQTDHQPCQTCLGRSWVPSTEGEPYFRLPCPNPNCRGGSDRTLWYGENAKQSKMYNRARWYRLSRFLHERPFPSDERQGLPIASPDPYARRTQYVWGRHRSSLDPRDGSSEQADVLLTAGGYTRRLPYTTEIVWPATQDTEQMFRDHAGGGDVYGWTKFKLVSDAGDVFTSGPTQGSIIKENNLSKVTEPVQGYITEGRKNFWLGGADPNTNEIHNARSYKPTQPGAIRVSGKISRQIEFLPFQLRFFQAFWDAFNTIHWQYNPNENTQAQLQYAVREANGTFVNWKDVKPTNAKYNANLDAWLIDPFTFHAYWDTHSQTLFEDGKDYTLRIRLFSPQGNVVVPFIFSPVFKILRNVANPVSVLSTEYEPFSKIVTIKLRVDDTQNDQYNLTRFWYSVDDGVTWRDLPRGDIYGELSYLTSDTANSQNVHTIYWNTAGLSLTPGDKFRIKIESVPSDTLDTATLPFFKWYSPNNPYLDDAEQALAELLGRIEKWRYDDAEKKWKPNNPPVYNPGLLALYQQEYERIRLHPARNPGPSGLYPFLGPSGNVVDTNGYTQWLSETYAGEENHGQAMNRVATEIDNITRVSIPQAQQQQSYRENEIRRNLIEQGFYAEEHFLGTSPNITESVMIQPVSNTTGETLPNQVERWWRFKVQKVADGGDRLTDDDGNFSPREITPLEQVFYKWQMDRTESFDSQPFNQPLREIITNERGERLSVSLFFGGQVSQKPNPSIDDPNANRPTQDSTLSTESDKTITVGGVLKVRPSDLPGQYESDQMVAGQTTWDGIYYWRVAAYNAIAGPANFRPRPRIKTVVNNGDGSVSVTYRLEGHHKITRASAMYDGWYGQTIGHWYSTTMLTTPIWSDFTTLNFVSDRRAPITDPSRNPLSWTPPGTNRLHPCIFYDNEKEQYILFYTKNGFTQERIGNAWVNNRYRPCSARMMRLPNVCEYANYFEDDPNKILMRPCVFKVGETYWMFSTAIPDVGETGFIVVSTSSDAHNWSTPVAISGHLAGINPCVVFNNGVFHMWYERRPSNNTVIAHATSTNGYDWTMAPTSPVLQGSGDYTFPCALKTETGWKIAFNSGQQILTAESTDGITWTNQQVMLDAMQMEVDGWWDIHWHVPSNPWIFWDNYFGNQTLFVAANWTNQDTGVTQIRIARWEDREWNQFSSGYMSEQNPSMNDMPNNTDGSYRFSLWWAPFDPSDNVKVRIQFEQPNLVTEYHRQSAWVDRNNTSEVDGYIEPTAYTFNSALTQYPYMLMPEQNNV